MRAGRRLVGLGWGQADEAGAGLICIAELQGSALRTVQANRPANGNVGCGSIQGGGGGGVSEIIATKAKL